MTVVALTSVKGSPGVTTTTLALGAVWPRGPEVLVAECDPAGGDVATRFGLSADRGLVSLAAEARRSRGPGLLWRHTQDLPGGLRVLSAPAGAEQTQAALRMVIGHRELLAGVAADPQTMMLADCGRLDLSSPVQPILRHAQVVLVCVEPRFDRLASLAARLPTLQQAHRHVGVVLVGSGSYGGSEITEALDVKVAATLPRDTRAAAIVGGGGRTWVLRRLPLLRETYGLARRLASAPALAPERPPGAQRPEPPVGRTAPQPARSGLNGTPVTGRQVGYGEDRPS